MEENVYALIKLSSNSFVGTFKGSRSELECKQAFSHFLTYVECSKSDYEKALSDVNKHNSEFGN